MKPTLSIAAIGINHKVCSLDELEGVKRRKPFEKLRETLYPAVISEFVAIDTCNRTELYYATQDPERAEADIKKLFGPVNTYTHQGTEVVDHLFRVTAGLDSMLIGESDIVRQVRTSYDDASKAGHVGPILNQLFQRAVHTSKVVRSSTKIDSGVTSLARYAVLQMEKSFGELKGKDVVVLGAGQMGNKLGSYLTDEGVTTITYVNRSLDEAEPVAQKHHAQAMTLDHLDECIASTSILFTAVTVKEPIISHDRLATIMATRPQQPLHIMDLGVPRNVDPKVKEIPGVDLYNVEHLRDHVGEAKQERAEAIKEAKSYIDHESQEFWEWYEAHQAGKQLGAVKPVS